MHKIKWLQEMKKLESKYENAIEQYNSLLTADIHLSITVMNSVIDSVKFKRYELINCGHDVYVWEYIELTDVALATFEQDYWVFVDGEMIYFDSETGWRESIKKYFDIG